MVHTHTHLYIYIYKCQFLRYDAMPNLLLTNYRLLQYLGDFILEPVSEMIMADICNNNYVNISCLPLSRVHVLK